MFQPIPEDRELEVVYLAPELQQNGIVTEKVGNNYSVKQIAFGPIFDTLRGDAGHI